MCRQGKKRNRISNRIGNPNNYYFLINQNISKPQIILMSLSFKAEKKVKSKKRKEMIYNGKKTENCDTRTYDVIRRNFEKSNSDEITSYAIWEILVLSSIF